MQQTSVSPQLRFSTRDAVLLDALCARQGIVCMVGAGGKKSSMYRLAHAHPGRVAITASVHIPPFPDWLDATQVVTDGAGLAPAVLAQAARADRIAYACHSAKPGRYAGVDADRIAALHAAAGFDLTLVKADGARRRLIKGPGGRDPILPPGVSTVVAVVSMQVAGQPLDGRTAHYLEAITQLTGVAPGETLTPAHIAAVLCAMLDAPWLAPQARVVPLLNMVEDAAARDAAAETAALLLAQAPRLERVVAASMTGAEPLVAVHRRQ